MKRCGGKGKNETKRKRGWTVFDRERGRLSLTLVLRSRIQLGACKYSQDRKKGNHQNLVKGRKRWGLKEGD